MRIAVTGKSGQVVQALSELCSRDEIIVAVGRPELDLATEGPFKGALAAARPDVIVSAGAYTAVDKAESDADPAFSINGRGAGLVARAAGQLDVPLIHISTDYVFDGTKGAPWIETDATGPLNVYGASKLAGERAVTAEATNSAILRVAWVFSPFGTNFVKSMIRLGATRDEIAVVADQHGAPTSAHDIGTGILTVARNLFAFPDRAELRGIFHMGAGGVATWAEFAEAIFAGMERRGAKPVRVRRITTKDYPTPARRPRNSLLDSAKIKRLHGVALPDWRVSLARVLDRLATNVHT
jgi:dTDP-4-dehydrorhamnose reductase